MGDLFGVKRGIICQQVNCLDAMGAGLAKAIMDKYPEVAEDYHKSFKWADAKNLFGCYRLVKVDEDLYVANIYSQFEYGNPQITGRVYTDADKLVECVQAICDSHPELPVFLPRSKDTDNDKDGIGCGLGGESWEKLSEMFKGLDKRNLYLLDSLKGIIHPLDPEKKKVVPTLNKVLCQMLDGDFAVAIKDDKVYIYNTEYTRVGDSDIRDAILGCFPREDLKDLGGKLLSVISNDDIQSYFIEFVHTNMDVPSEVYVNDLFASCGCENWSEILRTNGYLMDADYLEPYCNWLRDGKIAPLTSEDIALLHADKFEARMIDAYNDRKDALEKSENTDAEQLRVSYLVLGAPVYYQSVKSPEEARLVINSIANFMNQMVENGTFPDHCSTASLEYFDKDEEDWLEWEDEYGYTLDEHFENEEADYERE